VAHNALIRGTVGSGAWTNVVLTPLDLETFDQRQFQSANFDLGGAWAPASVVTLGGAGLELTTTLALTGTAVTMTGSGTVTLGALSTFTANGGTSLGHVNLLALYGAAGVEPTGTLSFATGSSLTGNTIATLNFQAGSALSFAAGATITGSPSIAAGATLTAASGATILFPSGSFLQTNAGATAQCTSTVEIDGPLTVTAAAVLSGATTLSGATGLTNTMTLSGGGHIVKRVISASTTVDTTYGIADADMIAVNGGPSRIHTITSTGATTGAQILVYMPHAVAAVTSPVFLVELKRDDSSLIVALTNNTTHTWARLVFRAGQWEASEYGGV
jgi:hypothetical protein